MKCLAIILLLISVATSSTLQRRTAVSRRQAWQSYSSTYPMATDDVNNLTYTGVYRSGVEAFLGIHYGQDTSGQNRYRNPRPYTYTAGSTVQAQTPGPACPQPQGAVAFPIYLSNITDVSEDCLLLNVNRPNGTKAGAKLPVMVFIHGGSFITSSKDELVIQPSGLILESIMNGLPIMHVAMNYRLGSFGFAQSGALQQEGSENAGLKDQRLALEWVKNHIEAFGGDPNQITIFGQSSGGLAVGLQIMAYGAQKPLPFQQGICESQALEGGITGNFTRIAMTRLLAAVGCNSTGLDSPDTVSCLRGLSMQQLLTAQTDNHMTDAAANIGDEWLPVVDGDFLPDAPSNLITQGKFGKVNAVIGWCDGDADIIVSTDVATAQDSDTFIRDYLPGFNNTSLQTLQNLYPISDFQPNPAANLTAEFYRTSRVVRDIVFVCTAMHYGQAIAKSGGHVYHYDQNQTFLNPALTSLGLPDLGVIHTSEFAYVFGNLSHYDVDSFPFQPNQSDYSLLQRESRSWSTFANTGSPSQIDKSTLQGWDTAFTDPNNPKIFVIGGGQEGLFAESGSANAALESQKLVERCAFFNDPEIIKQLNY